MKKIIKDVFPRDILTIIYEYDSSFHEYFSNRVVPNIRNYKYNKAVRWLMMFLYEYENGGDHSL